LRADAVAIWHAGVDAVRPAPLVAAAVRELLPELQSARNIIVVGGGKAGHEMARGLEAAVGSPPNLRGVVNVPDGGRGPGTPGSAVVRHPARPVGHNLPTAEGVRGVTAMLKLLAAAGPDDVAVCLLSGGGSALLPLPAPGITLEDKLAVTKAVAAAGATIGELNAVRKHLSAVKGGRLAEAFRGRNLFSLIISDVVGDPLDVIASGPTAPDPTTFADARAVLDRYGIVPPPAVAEHLRRAETETPKSLSPTVVNRVIGSNAVALAAAARHAAGLGYQILTPFGTALTGEASQVGRAIAGVMRSVRSHARPEQLPACILAGGETTVTLGPDPGTGGRNQELVLAAMLRLGDELAGTCVLSGGTDGEDGPTDAAGAVATLDTWERAKPLDPAGHLARHDAHPLFARCGGLLRTGLTGTNVMDVQVLLVT
jgi:hydroxypyruvate reductase/glycerate 2-kinase